MGVIALPLLSPAPSDKDSMIPQVSDSSQLIKELTLSEFAAIRDQTLLDRPLRKVPPWSNPSSPFAVRVAPRGQQQGKDWQWVLSAEGMGGRVGDYLWYGEWEQLRGASRGLRRWALMTALGKENSWEMTMWRLGPFLAKSNGLRESGADEDYEHSEDLDRTSGYLEQWGSEDLIAEQQGKIDRIVTTMSFRVRYFQGIMPMCASLLQCFNEQVAYWLLRLLLARCRLVQVDVPLYTAFTARLEKEVRLVLPQVHAKLEECGLGVDYFAMKWVMGLFSEDMSQPMQLAVWDVLCQCELDYLIYLTLALLQSQQQEILQGDADSINALLKTHLKARLSQLNCDLFISRSKQLYLQRAPAVASLPPE